MASCQSFGRVADEHVCGELFRGEEGIHVFEVRCLDLAVGQDAGAEARLELLGDVEEDVEDSGAGLVEFLLDEGEVVHAGDGEGWDAVGCADLDHVGEGDAAGGSGADQAALKEAGLGLTDGEIAAVVQDEDFDGELVADDGLELLNVHLETAVAGEADDAAGRVATATPMAAGRS